MTEVLHSRHGVLACYRLTGDPGGTYYLTKVVSYLSRDVDFIMSISEPYSICIYIEPCHYNYLMS